MDKCTDNRTDHCDITELILKTAVTLSQTGPGSYVSAEQALLKHCKKGEIALNEQFPHFPHCFLPSWTTFCHLYKI